MRGIRRYFCRSKRCASIACKADHAHGAPFIAIATLRYGGDASARSGTKNCRGVAASPVRGGKPGQRCRFSAAHCIRAGRCSVGFVHSRAVASAWRHAAIRLLDDEWLTMSRYFVHKISKLIRNHELHLVLGKHISHDRNGFFVWELRNDH